MKKVKYGEYTGNLIDTFIRIERVLRRYEPSITDFVNLDMANDADLSGRQIERMRRYDGYPEDKSIIKLINALPMLSFLNYTDFVRRLLLNDQTIAEFLLNMNMPKTMYIITRSSEDAMKVLKPIAEQFMLDSYVQNKCMIKLVGLESSGVGLEKQRSLERLRSIISNIVFNTLSNNLTTSRTEIQIEHKQIDVIIDAYTQYVTILRDSELWDRLNSPITIIFKGEEEVHGLKHIEGSLFSNLRSNSGNTRIAFEQDPKIDLSSLDVEGWLFMKDAEIVSIMENLT